MYYSLSICNGCRIPLVVFIVHLFQAYHTWQYMLKVLQRAFNKTVDVISLFVTQECK